MNKIAILGGTFDPVHNGHIKLGLHAYQQFDIDELWYMPAFCPPHKSNTTISSYEDRCNMVRLAIEKYDFFKCSEFEADSLGKSYTCDTLEKLSAFYPQTSFSFVVGADSFYEIETWYRPEVIMKLSKLIVAARNYKDAEESLFDHAKHLKEKYNANIGFIESDQIDISSDRLRKMFRSGNDNTQQYLPAQVYEYIINHNLYKEV